MFAIEVRTFHVQPEPMHVVSLIIHLINTWLVGIVAVKLGENRFAHAGRWYLLALPMLLFGLHPLLVEPVVWIGCQFDLMATLLMLLGLIFNLSLRRPWPRGISVAICFFLAACAKESAAAFPFILIIFDWLALDEPQNSPKPTQLRIFLKKNWLVYALAFAAGMVYLTLRNYALGGLAIEADADRLTSLARFQQASFLYSRYWQMFFWPMTGMGPLHPLDRSSFFILSAVSLLRDILSLGIILLGIALTLRRICAGGLILVVTFALLPVLHIVPGNLDTSLYHERYAMTALAFACALLPLTLKDISLPKSSERILSLATKIILFFWLVLAVIGIRQLVPLWSTQLNLWKWALQENPNFILAKEELIEAYITSGAHAEAWQLIDNVVAAETPCTDCMLNAADLALLEGNPARASIFLDKIQNAADLHTFASRYRFYLTLRAELLLLQGHSAQAEQMARNTIAMDNLDPQPYLVLATALARQGKLVDAQQQENSALLLLAPEQRDYRRQAFEKLLTSLSEPSTNRH